MNGNTLSENEKKNFKAQPSNSPIRRFFKSRSGCVFKIVLLLGLFVLGIYKLYYAEIYRGKIVSPCGKYRIDYYYYAGESVIPMAPGSGGDKTGCLYIYREAGNKMLYREELPMLQLVGDIRFSSNVQGETDTIYSPTWLWFELEKK